MRLWRNKKCSRTECRMQYRNNGVERVKGAKNMSNRTRWSVGGSSRGSIRQQISRPRDLTWGWLVMRVHSGKSSDPARLCHTCRPCLCVVSCVWLLIWWTQSIPNQLASLKAKYWRFCSASKKLENTNDLYQKKLLIRLLHAHSSWKTPWSRTKTTVLHGSWTQAVEERIADMPRDCLVQDWHILPTCKSNNHLHWAKYSFAYVCLKT